MKKALLIVCLFLFAVSILAVQPKGVAAQQKVKSASSSSAVKMGWLFVDPRNKWGLPKEEALRVIQKEVRMPLKIIGDNPGNTLLVGNLAMVIGKKVVPLELSFTCVFDSEGLSKLNIMWVFDKASVSDVRFLWKSLIRLAQNKFNAPKSYLVKGYRTEGSALIPFGTDFEKGLQFYDMDWIHGNTASSFMAARMPSKTGDGRMHNLISLYHKKVRDN